MDEETPRSAMGESNGPQRRRSARLLSSPPTNANVDNMAPSAAVKRSITVRKIAPRKTTVPSEHDKENVQRRSAGSQQRKPKISTPGPAQIPPQKKATMPSPILASSPPPPPPPRSRSAPDPQDSVWSRKVRRSYSRISNQSFNSPETNSRETMFGFEKLNTPEVLRKVGRSKTGLEVSGSLSGLSSFTTLLEGDDCAASFPEPDLNIPGVVVVKEKKRRKKVQQIGITELDTLAAKMNAEFEEAEGFQLIVE
ncbi:sororin [Polymixia lowei]